MAVFQIPIKNHDIVYTVYLQIFQRQSETYGSDIYLKYDESFNLSSLKKIKFITWKRLMEESTIPVSVGSDLVKWSDGALFVPLIPFTRIVKGKFMDLRSACNRHHLLYKVLELHNRETKEANSMIETLQRSYNGLLTDMNRDVGNNLEIVTDYANIPNSNIPQKRSMTDDDINFMNKKKPDYDLLNMSNLPVTFNTNYV